MYNEKIQHARFPLPKPVVHGGHPFRNQVTHARLLEYLQERLKSDEQNRDSRVTRYSQIDRDVAGWMLLSEEDKKRKIDHVRTGSPQATAISLPLTWVHLDDMMTYYAQTFAPNRGMFYHTAKPDDTTDATQIVTLMNNHAVYCGYYTQLLRTIFAILKYNLGGMTTFWATDFGPRLEALAGGGTRIEPAPIFSGNKVLAFDMYNTLWDPSVEPTNLYKDGEWFARVEMKSHYWLKNKCLEGAYFNCDEHLDGESAPDSTQTKWYKDPPSETNMQADESNASQSWFSVLSGASSYTMSGSFELTEIHVRINPNDFGLIEGNREARLARNRYEVWRFTILNNEKIIEARHMNNIHGWLPAFFGVANDDSLGQTTKSPAEILNPLQEFSSFLLNAHVEANRKNLYGTTYYDPSRIDLDSVPKGEVAARVPIKTQGYGQDIRTMVYRENQVLDTKQTLGDLDGMMGIIDKFFPTQSLPSQIAGIDRAVDSQVAAVQQGSNRRQHKGARLLDDSLMRPLRFGMYYNIVQYQEDAAEVLDYHGNTVTIDLTKLRATNLAYVIGQGLKAIDRQAAASQIQGMFFALIQAPAAGQQVDIIKILDFWTSMMDIEASMEDFRLAPNPAQALGPEGAAQGGEVQPGIAPATDPASLTAPIYG